VSGPERTGQGQPGALPEVYAAGGLLWRAADGGVEVVLVHRPRYDDWSIPKGKRDPGEDDEQTARREVEEETGVTGLLGAELPSTGYVDRNGRAKRVRYWLMTPATGHLAGCNEVDEAVWVPLHEAFDLVSYPRDREVLAAAASLLDGGAPGGAPEP